ncbi:unnamed protein product [Rhizophagus irregularis]|nr:unnamed protein product [Rhizophagus irregularis]
MYTKNGMLMRESYYFGGSKRKIVYLKETKPIIIATEEAVILKEAITKEKCNNDRTEAITQERSPPVVPGYPMPYSQTLEETASGYESDIKINTHSVDEEKADGNSDDPSINNRKKRKHDLEINEELRDEVYYKLLPSILKISETIQSSRDYREKSYVVRDKNEKEKYRIMANKKVIYQISLRNLRNKTL